jgi:hypothetical protein
MNRDQIESAIEHAIDALGLAKLALSKSALPILNDSDVLRKVDTLTSALRPIEYAADPTMRAIASSDAIMKRAQSAVADLERRIAHLEAGREPAPKYAIERGATHE